MEKQEILQKTWKVHYYHEENKPSLLRLSKLQYQEKDLGTEAYFDWLYRGGPAGKTHVVVAEDTETGDVIGFSCYLPLAVKAGDLDGLCIMGGNAVVHPDYRRLGVYSSLQPLVRQAIQNALFTYGFPKPTAVTPHTKTGRKPVGKIPLLARPIDIQQITNKRFRNPGLRIATNLAWIFTGKTIIRPHSISNRAEVIEIARESNFDKRFDRFWDQVAGKYEIIVKRNADFLNWRFCQTGFRHYEIFSASTPDGMVGYLVLRSTELEGIPTGLITDLLVVPGKLGDKAGLLLVQGAMSRFKEAHMALAGCLMFAHTHEYRILQQAGFMEVPTRFSPQVFQVMTMSISPETPIEYLQKPERWFLTMANHDAI